MKMHDSVWLLIMIDDNQVIGEKACVSVYDSTEDAKIAMQEEIDIFLSEKDGYSSESIEYSEDSSFAMTKDEYYSWEITEANVWGKNYEH